MRKDWDTVVHKVHILFETGRLNKQLTGKAGYVILKSDYGHILLAFEVIILIKQKILYQLRTLNFSLIINV